eukprot:scaffold22361_cov103-Phaeocystis_antarctica.AAC.5
MVVEGVLEGCTLPQMYRALCDRRKVNTHPKATPSKAAKVDMRRTAVSPQGASRWSSGRSPQKVARAAR